MLPSLDAPDAQRTTVRNLLLQGELLKILDVLEREQIPCVVLKGIPLAKRLGVRLNDRQIFDNDLLLQREDVERGVRALAELGYAPKPFADLTVDLKYAFQHALFTRRHGVRMVAEVHWQCFTPDLFRVPEELAWQRTTRIDLDGHAVVVFDPALTLIHLAAHYLQHGFTESRILRDVARAWNAFCPSLDMADLAQLAARTDCLPALQFALATALDLGLIQSHPFPASLRVKLTRLFLPARHLATDTTTRDYARTVPSYLLCNPRSVTTYVRRAVFPPAEQLPAMYKEVPSWRLYARYITRPFRPLARALGWKPE